MFFTDLSGAFSEGKESLIVGPNSLLARGLLTFLGDFQRRTSLEDLLGTSLMDFDHGPLPIKLLLHRPMGVWCILVDNPF